MPATAIQSNINSNNSGMGKLAATGSTPMTAQQVADVAAYLGNWPSTLTFAVHRGRQHVSDADCHHCREPERALPIRSAA